MSLFQSIEWLAGARVPARRQPALPLTTERLVLREFAAADAERPLPDFGSDEYWRYELFRRPTALHLRAVVHQAGRARGRKPRRAYFLAAEAREHGTLVGFVRLSVKGVRRDVGDVGWVIYPAFSGRGLATEMAGAAVRMGLDELALARVSAQCHEDNAACLRIFEKLGMRPEKSLRRYAYGRGTWIPTKQWVIAAAEHRARHLPSSGAKQVQPA